MTTTTITELVRSIGTTAPPERLRESVHELARRLQEAPTVRLMPDGEHVVDELYVYDDRSRIEALREVGTQNKGAVEIRTQPAGHFVRYALPSHQDHALDAISSIRVPV